MRTGTCFTGQSCYTQLCSSCGAQCATIRGEASSSLASSATAHQPHTSPLHSLTHVCYDQTLKHPWSKVLTKVPLECSDQNTYQQIFPFSFQLFSNVHSTFWQSTFQNSISPTWSCFTLCTALCLRGESRSLTSGRWLLFTCWTGGDSSNFCCCACMAATIWGEEEKCIGD